MSGLVFTHCYGEEEGQENAHCEEQAEDQDRGARVSEAQHVAAHLMINSQEETCLINGCKKSS